MKPGPSPADTLPWLEVRTRPSSTTSQGTSNIPMAWIRDVTARHGTHARGSPCVSGGSSSNPVIHGKVEACSRAIRSLVREHVSDQSSTHQWIRAMAGSTVDDECCTIERSDELLGDRPGPSGALSLGVNLLSREGNSQTGRRMPAFGSRDPLLSLAVSFRLSRSSASKGELSFPWNLLQHYPRFHGKGPEFTLKRA